MEISLQRKLCWLDPVPRQVMKKCSQINLLSKEGQVTCVPAQFLIASSTFLKSILTIPSPLCRSSANSISLPSTASFTLKLLSQILCMGETEESGGLEITMRNMKELQDVIVMLGLNINLCPKYKKAIGPFRSDVVKEEVLDLEDNPKEVEVQNVCDKLVQKKSTVAKMSSSRGKYRQSRMMKEFKKKMKKSLLGEDSFDELDADCSAQTPEKRVDIQALKRSSSGKSGRLKDFEVKLAKCANEGTLKKSASIEERSFMCNTCGVKFAKYPSLRRHYRENHGIQGEMPGTEVVKPSVKKCPKCDLKFKFRSSLSRHLKRVHINESKQIDSGKELHHKCGECDKMFSNFHKLRRHRKDQHSKMIVKPGLQGIRSVSCQDCGLVLTSMNDMIQHSQEVHKRIVETIENVKMEVIHKDNSSKIIKCSDCDKSFNRMSDMRKHIERYHEGKTYGCGECDAIFSYKHNASRHCVVKGHDKELIYMVVDLP